MWIVFSTVDMGNNNGTYEDFYTVVNSEAAAKAMYEKAIKRERTYCAGYGPISQSTEPHWTDSETTAKTETGGH